ncbi:MAG: Verru_Chthon cassette protein B [Verrucomicrobiales bacterium]
MNASPALLLTRHRRGFSLVEVTVAMGIVATVLVALLALLPYGMDSIREAKSTQVQARIANEIISEIQVADWGSEPAYKKLADYDGTIRRYDSEGTLIVDKADKNTADTIYKVRIEIPMTERVRLRGMPTDSGRYARRLIVKVAFAPGDKQVDFDSDKFPLPYRSFSSQVVKLGRDRVK